MRRIKGQTGMSLVEALIILLVLMLLTGVLAPNIYEFIPDSQTVKVKEDCEAIGIEIMKLVRDVGPCLKTDASQVGCPQDYRADVLYSRGTFASSDVIPGSFSNPNINTHQWTVTASDNVDHLENQLTTNEPGYALPAADAFNMTFPAMGLGWRGAYLPSPIGPDPWGKPYLVNTGFLAVATDLVDQFSVGPPAVPHSNTFDGWYGWNADVFCISAGFNKLYETSMYSNANGGTNRGGDDFIFVISGASR